MKTKLVSKNRKPTLTLLSSENHEFIERTKFATGHSITGLMNIAIDAARATGLFDNLEPRETAEVKRAKALLCSKDYIVERKTKVIRRPKSQEAVN
jgi:hypothetical protein